jgi:hypothetical protein
MTRRQPTPEEIDARMATVAEGRNPEYRVRSTAISADDLAGRPANSKLADVLVKAELLLDKVETVIDRLDNELHIKALQRYNAAHPPQHPVSRS